MAHQANEMAHNEAMLSDAWSMGRRIGPYENVESITVLQK
jgi:hypothetical protein